MKKEVLIETSARHAHVSKADLETLFGGGYSLTFKKDLSQPGQFVCEERIAVAGPKGSFPSVVILGPVRPDTQVEVSASDARVLGIDAVVKESGDIAGTPGLKLTGPKGSVDIKNGAIVAKRHIHMTPEDAKKYDLADRQIVNVKIDSESRSLVFGDVVVRVHPNFKLAMHIDTDECNAVMAAPGAVGVIEN
ncbi:MAG: phosphate propanoyltransferase [Oscillospiraceae bacterium]|nr:phosphate propanoyltransferase [Oscillospiraceae bacterium]